MVIPTGASWIGSNIPKSLENPFLKHPKRSITPQKRRFSQCYLWDVSGCFTSFDTFWHGSLHFCGTIPETNIALESLGLEEEFPFGKASSQVGYLSKMSCWEKLCGPWFFCRPRKDPPLKRPKKGQKRTEFSSTSCDWLSTVFFWNNCN